MRAYALLKVLAARAALAAGAESSNAWNFIDVHEVVCPGRQGWSAINVSTPTTNVYEPHVMTFFRDALQQAQVSFYTYTEGGREVAVIDNLALQGLQSASAVTTYAQGGVRRLREAAPPEGRRLSGRRRSGGSYSSPRRRSYSSPRRRSYSSPRRRSYAYNSPRRRAPYSSPRRRAPWTSPRRREPYSSPRRRGSSDYTSPRRRGSSGYSSPRRRGSSDYSSPRRRGYTSPRRRGAVDTAHRRRGNTPTQPSAAGPAHRRRSGAEVYNQRRRGYNAPPSTRRRYDGYSGGSYNTYGRYNSPYMPQAGYYGYPNQQAAYNNYGGMAPMQTPYGYSGMHAHASNTPAKIALAAAGGLIIGGAGAYVINEHFRQENGLRQWEGYGDKCSGPREPLTGKAFSGSCTDCANNYGLNGCYIEYSPPVPFARDDVMDTGFIPADVRASWIVINFTKIVGLDFAPSRICPPAGWTPPAPPVTTTPPPGGWRCQGSISCPAGALPVSCECHVDAYFAKHFLDSDTPGVLPVPCQCPASALPVHCQCFGSVVPVLGPNATSGPNETVPPAPSNTSDIATTSGAPSNTSDIATTSAGPSNTSSIGNGQTQFHNQLLDFLHDHRGRRLPSAWTPPGDQDLIVTFTALTELSDGSSNPSGPGGGDQMAMGNYLLVFCLNLICCCGLGCFIYTCFCKQSKGDYGGDYGGQPMAHYGGGGGFQSGGFRRDDDDEDDEDDSPRHRGDAPVGDPQGALDALRGEYVEGEEGAFGNYLESGVPDREIGVLETYENRVRNSGNAEAELERIRNEWGIRRTRGLNFNAIAPSPAQAPRLLAVDSRQALMAAPMTPAAPARTLQLQASAQPMAPAMFYQQPQRFPTTAVPTQPLAQPVTTVAAPLPSYAAVPPAAPLTYAAAPFAAVGPFYGEQPPRSPAM